METKSKKINAAEAHRMFQKHGIKISLPTVIKRLMDWKLFEQPTGVYGGIMIDEAALEEAIITKYKQEKAGRPKGKLNETKTRAHDSPGGETPITD